MSYKWTLPCKWCGSTSVAHQFTEKKRKSILRYWKCSECKNQFETLEIISNLCSPNTKLHNSAILTEKDVIEIRLRRKNGVPIKEIVEWTGMSRSCILRVLSRKTWKHV